MEHKLRHGSGQELSRRVLPGQSSEGKAVSHGWTVAWTMVLTWGDLRSTCRYIASCRRTEPGVWCEPSCSPTASRCILVTRLSSFTASICYRKGAPLDLGTADFTGGKSILGSSSQMEGGKGRRKEAPCGARHHGAEGSER